MNQTQNDKQKLLIALITAMVLIVMTLLASIFMVTRRPVVVVIPGGGEAGSVVPSPLPSPVVETVELSPPPPEIVVSRLERVPQIDDPLDSLWNQVPAIDIPLQAQQVAEPMLPAETVATIRVQAAHDTQRYVWRLTWEQPEPAQTSDFGQFSDAVAIQFPLVDGAPYTMGGPNMPVSMLYWRALWQKDVDEGFQDTVVSRPEAYNDFYWFASTTGPYPADKLDGGDPMAKQWMIAAAAGNPMADFGRKCPMEEITAHGFGTSTHVSNSPGQARGRWEQGRWHVVFERPINTADQLIARFQQNPQQQLMALAVWDGQAQNRGGQKHITNWIPMRIAP